MAHCERKYGLPLAEWAELWLIRARVRSHHISSERGASLPPGRWCRPGRRRWSPAGKHTAADTDTAGESGNKPVALNKKLLSVKNLQEISRSAATKKPNMEKNRDKDVAAGQFWLLCHFLLARLPVWHLGLMPVIPPAWPALYILNHCWRGRRVGVGAEGQGTHSPGHNGQSDTTSCTEDKT